MYGVPALRIRISRVSVCARSLDSGLPYHLAEGMGPPDKYQEQPVQSHLRMNNDMLPSNCFSSGVYKLIID